MRNILRVFSLKRHPSCIKAVMRPHVMYPSSSQMLSPRPFVRVHYRSYSTPAADLSIVNSQSPNEIASAVKYAALRHYRHLVDTTPSLQCDPSTSEGIDMLYWRLMQNDNFFAAMEPLHCDQDTRKLMENINNSMYSFSGQEAEILFFLLTMGHHTNPVLPKLVARCKDQIETMDVQELTLMARVVSILGTDYSLLRIIFKRIQVLVDKGEIPKDSDNLHAFCSLILKLQSFTSFQLGNRLQEYLFQTMTDLPFSALSNEAFIAISSATCKSSLINTEQKQLVITAKEHLKTCISDLTPLQLAQVASNFLGSRFYDDTTRKLIDVKVGQSAKETPNLTLGNAIALFTCLSHRSDQRLIKKMEGIVLDKLQHETPDKALVKFLADSLHKVNSQNVALIEWVQEKIPDLSIDKQFVMFLTEKEFVRQSHKNAVVEKLFEEMEPGKGNKLRCIHILTLMLPLTQTHFKQMTKLISTWNFVELSKCVEGLQKVNKQQNQLHGELSRQVRYQYKQLETLLYVNLSSKVDTTNTLLTYNTISMLWHAKKKVPTELMDRMMGNLCDQAQKTSLTDTKSLHWHLRCFTRTRYYDPALCDHLSASVLAAGEKHGHTNEMEVIVLKLMSHLGYCGHIPPNIHELMPMISWLLEQFNKADMLDEYLRLVLNLAILKSAPTSLLASVFERDFLARLNRFMLNNPVRRDQTYQTLVFLNQCAVIDSPELQVPWFLEEVARRLHERNPLWLQRETRAVTQVLGGSEYFRKFIFAPYCHLIEFELFVDRSQRVPQIIPWQKHAKSTTQFHQRVALTVENMGRHCMTRENAQPRLNGRRQRTLEHLEKCGYTVIPLPYYEWGGGDVNHVTCLRNKLNNALGLELKYYY